MSASDALYHHLFSHPLMAEQLVRDFVSEAMAVGLDFAGMERINAKFHDRDGKRREGDVIWRIPTSLGDDVVLHILCEFQSTVDWWMAVRTQVYERLRQHIIAEKKLKAGDRLPPVLTLVIYNGEPRWTAPVGTAPMIASPEDSPLWPWQPQVRYHLLDMGAVSEDDLAARDSLAALLVHLEHPHEPEELAELIDAVVSWFRPHPGYEDLKRLFTELVEMRSMSANLAEGRAEGEVHGEAKALIRLLERRFGPLPVGIADKVAAADVTLIEQWFDRAIDSPDPNAVFGAPN